MNNVVHLPVNSSENARNQEVSESELTPSTIFQTLYGLFIADVIGKNALNLGMLVCERLQYYEVNQLVLTGEQAQKSFVKINELIYSGPLSKSLPDYIEALQDLHFRAGLLNNLVEPSTALEDCRRHFTLSPTLTAGRHYSFATPIYFRIINLSHSEFLGSTQSLISNKFKDLTAYPPTAAGG